MATVRYCHQIDTSYLHKNEQSSSTKKRKNQTLTVDDAIVAFVEDSNKVYLKADNAGSYYILICITLCYVIINNILYILTYLFVKNDFIR
jgi:F0F1-type ATP synthase membrane subunit a